MRPCASKRRLPIGSCAMKPAASSAHFDSAISGKRLPSCTRLLGSCPDLRRAAPAAAGFVLVLLQRNAHTLGVGQGRAARTSYSTIWDHHRHANSIWIASSLRADMIFGKDRQEDPVGFQLLEQGQRKKSCRFHNLLPAPPIDLWTRTPFHRAIRRHHITTCPRRPSSPILQNLIFGTPRCTSPKSQPPPPLPH